jgi:CubicO group peptidase (beta-lactamase class C family)
VIERAGGARLHELIARELWQPMGAEFDAEITVDAHGNPMADGGICASLRDLSRFGQLYLQRGGAAGRPVVPAGWVDDTIRGAPDGVRAFAEGGRPPGYPPGAHYRNCWWIRDPGLPFYQASGINGQNIFVHVPSRTVAAKFSTWPTALSPAEGVTAEAVLAISNALQAGQLQG